MNKSIWCAVVIGSVLLLSFSANPPQGNSGAPFDGTCARSGCHSSSSTPMGRVTIEGIPDEVEAGRKYPFTIKLETTSGGPARAGFQMVAVGPDEGDAGQITDPGTSSTTSTFSGRTYFEHQPAKSFGSGDIVEYNASWTAPSSGEATFYVSGILANGSGSSGDTYVQTNATFTVKSGAAALSASIDDVDDVLCFGDNNGRATITASGGSESYTYIWSNGETSATATQLPAGENKVTVSDGESEVEVNVTINEPEPIGVDIEAFGSLECTDSELSIGALASGGTRAYTYLWSNSATTQEITINTPGLYNVTVSDTNGCSGVGNVSIFAEDRTSPVLETVASITLSLTESNSQVSIDNLDGILLSATDNCNEELTIDWSPKTFGCSDVGSSTLTITATDKGGNTSKEEVVVELEDAVNPTLTCISEVLRIATCAPLAYTTPIATDNCNNVRLELVSGIGINRSFPQGETIDMYLATDASGNTASCQITIINEPIIDITADITDISCAGASDGKVDLITDGTNLPINVSFANVINTNRLAAGTYEYTATDFTGCSVTGSFEITEPSELMIVESVITMPANTNSGDGNIDITVSGGTPPYTYSWMTENEFFSDEEDLQQIFPGTYQVNVEDARGCIIVSESFVVEELTSINDPGISAQINTFPNPATEYLLVELNDLSFNSAECTLYATDGSLIHNQLINGVDVTISLNGIPNGLYILKLRIDDDYVVRPVMVQTR